VGGDVYRGERFRQMDDGRALGSLSFEEVPDGVHDLGSAPQTIATVICCHRSSSSVGAT
jgi:hypothetical protein